jgi:hypothetical protein
MDEAVKVTLPIYLLANTISQSIINHYQYVVEKAADIMINAHEAFVLQEFVERTQT